MARRLRATREGNVSQRSSRDRGDTGAGSRRLTAGTGRPRDGFPGCLESLRGDARARRFRYDRRHAHDRPPVSPEALLYETDPRCSSSRPPAHWCSSYARSSSRKNHGVKLPCARLLGGRGHVGRGGGRQRNAREGDHLRRGARGRETVYRVVGVPAAARFSGPAGVNVDVIVQKDSALGQVSAVGLE